MRDTATGFAAIVVLVSVLLLASASGAPRASAAGLVVTTEMDTIFPVDDGFCTLREAIINANNDSAIWDDCPGVWPPGADSITFALGLDHIDLAAALPVITDPDGLTIIGSAVVNLTVHGQDTYRPFNVSPAGRLTLDRVIVTNGRSPTSGGGIWNRGELTLMSSHVYSSEAVDDGGGIHNEGALTLIDSTVEGNAAGNNGGGIFNDGGVLLANGSAISSNDTVFNGGGIHNDGGEVTLDFTQLRMNEAGFGGAILNIFQATLMMTNSEVLDNDSTTNGGGIESVDAGSISIVDSTVAGNETGGLGGGVMSANAHTTIIGSTVSGNESGGDGGGVYFRHDELVIANSTISENIGLGGGGVFVTQGGVGSTVASLINVTVTRSVGSGGIYNELADSVTLTNTIVADQGLATNDCEGEPITSGGHNLDSDGSCGFAAAGDISAGTANLAPLAEGGGPTRTNALLAGSDAIDAGNDAVCAAAPVNAVDQRGVARPGGTHCDIGAFEVEGDKPTDTPGPTPTATPNGTPTPTGTQEPTETATLTPTDTATPTATPDPSETAAPDEQLWGDVDCSGELTARDNQAELRFVLGQPRLGQTEPCPDIGDTVSVDGTQRIWGDDDCSGAISARDNQAKLRFILDQAPLSQTEPCPDVGSEASIEN